MKKLTVPFASTLTYESPLEDISACLDGLEAHRIDQEPWPLPGNKPNAVFRIAHSGACVYIKYQVEEDHIRARYRVANEPVYQDSCVEFFISLKKNAEYYNFEFNSIGTCLMSFGEKRQSREMGAAAVSDLIRRNVSITADSHSRARWQITMAIPAKVFFRSDLASVEGLLCSANFYKCGDKLPFPHYFAWNNINTPQPDFHQPAWFGEVQFSTGR